MVKKVRGIAISAGVTIGFLALLALAAKKTNVGDLLQDSLRGFGLNVGKGVTAPFQGILEGLTTGGQGLGESAVSLSEGFQKSVTGTLFGEERVFFDDSASATGKAEAKSIQPLDFSKFFNQSAIEQRIQSAQLISTPESRTGRVIGTPTFESGQAQESALEQAIRESREKYPQFFGS